MPERHTGRSARSAGAAPTVEQCEQRVRSAEQAAATRDASADALSAAAYVAAFAAHAARKGARPNGAEGAARAAAECPPHELAPRDLTVTVAVATDAATAILVKSGPDDLRFIRRDFERLKRRARKERWTDDTPVPPDVFGSLWFAGWSPQWTWGTNESRG